MKKTIKYLGRALIVLISIAILYVGGVILYGTVTDYQPEETIPLSVWGNADDAIEGNSFSFVIWNIGYAGLGEKEDFFYDGGEGVRPERTQHDVYMSGIERTLAEMSGTDFLLIQEIDTNSKRSYYGNQLHRIAANLPGYAYTYATNYQVDFVPMPLTTLPTNAYGRVQAGLGTYSKYAPTSATRLQFPGKFGWPKRVFMLDRCMLVTRYDLPSGQELIVVNTHNSAYDSDGTLKAAEMKYLKDFAVAEYDKGNYVIVGGDWNQNPPGFTNKFNASGEVYGQGIIEDGFMPEGWVFAYDPATPTNRNLSAAYTSGETTTDLIDYYLLSPNVEVLNINTLDMQFTYSDHQPVKLEVRLK